jgi:acyl-CoA thioesterase-1
MISVRQITLIVAFVSAFTLGVAGCTPHAQIVALWASNFAGNGVRRSDAFPAQLERMLAANGYKVRVTNAGVSGDTNEGMLSRLDSAVPNGTNIVILDVSGGTFNAQRKHLGDQAAGLAKILDRLKQPPHTSHPDIRPRHRTEATRWRPSHRGRSHHCGDPTASLGNSGAFARATAIAFQQSGSLTLVYISV